MTAVAFGVVALLLSGPVPSWLARAHWPLRAPRAAMVLWQSCVIAAVLSAFSCGLAIAANLLVPGPNGRPTTNPLHEIHSLGIAVWSVYVAVFILTLVIGARLMFTIVRVGVRTRARRAAHRNLIDLLDNSDRHDRDDQLCARDIRMLDVAERLAYCLPGLRQRVVVSEGAVAALAPDELAAVITHERAHLRARHDLIIEAFIAVHEAFPRFIRSSSALGAVSVLVEALADDQAVRATGPTQVGRALVACAGSTAPHGALAVGGPTTLARVQRLNQSPAAAWVSATAYSAAAAVLVIPTLAVAIPWLTELYRLVSPA